MRERVNEQNPGSIRPPGIWTNTEHPAAADPSILELARELVRIFRQTVAERRRGDGWPPPAVPPPQD